MTLERRQTDIDLKDIRLHMSNMSGSLMVLAEQAKVAAEELKENGKTHEKLYGRTEENKNEIQTLKTKQAFFQKGALLFVLTIVGIIGKWAYSLIHHTPPHIK